MKTISRMCICQENVAQKSVTVDVMGVQVPCNWWDIQNAVVTVQDFQFINSWLVVWKFTLGVETSW